MVRIYNISAIVPPFFCIFSEFRCWVWDVIRYIGPRPYASLYCPYRASITLKGFNNLAQGLAPGNQSARPWESIRSTLCISGTDKKRPCRGQITTKGRCHSISLYISIPTYPPYTVQLCPFRTFRTRRSLP